MFHDPLSSLVMLMEKEKVTTARDDEIGDFFNKYVLPHYDFTETELPAAREMFVGQFNQVVGDQPLLEYFNPKPDVTPCLMCSVTCKKMDKIQLGPIKHRVVNKDVTNVSFMEKGLKDLSNMMVGLYGPNIHINKDNKFIDILKNDQGEDK